MHVSPGFPASGGDSAPLLVAPGGKIYVDYQGYHMTSRTKFTMTDGAQLLHLVVGRRRDLVEAGPDRASVDSP